MKKFAVLYTDYLPVIDVLKYSLSNDCDISLYKNSDEFNYKDFDLVLLLNYEGDINFDALAVHYSLLPAFEGDTPIKQALVAGVKVTGISIYFTQTKKIVAQYPIFINNDMHFDDLTDNMRYLEQMILPVVIKKLINNEQFEMSSLLSKKSGCGGCSGCMH